MAAAEVLRPLYELMIAEVLASGVLHVDDTPVDLRDAQNKLKHKTYFWTYVGDPLRRDPPDAYGDLAGQFVGRVGF